MRGRTFPLILFAFLLAACLVPGAYAANLLHNSQNLSSGDWSSDGGWGVANGKYGEFKCTTCHEPGASNIKRIKSTITVPDTSKGNIPGGSVTFLNVTGATGMGDDTGGHGNSTKICEVCHTANKYHNFNTTNNTGGLTHNNKKDCTSCHTHGTGFAAAGCDTCHGNPPTTNNTDNSNNTGLVWNSNPTGATSPSNAGGHLVHNNKGYSCNACHAAYTTSPMGNNFIEMGFNFFGANRGGTFTGYTSPASPYTFKTNNPGTTVLRRNNYNNTCANLYCHGGGDSQSGKAALAGGTITTPSWVGASQAICGTCHGVTAAAVDAGFDNSHKKHAGTAAAGNLQRGCSTCHGTITNNNHVDGKVFWNLSTADPKIGASATYRGYSSGDTGANSLAPSATFGQCLSIYCHSNGRRTVQGPATEAPTWRTALTGSATCSSCHKGAVGATFGVMTSGNHTAHVNNAAVNGANYTCDACHYKTVAAGTNATLKQYSGVIYHVNKSINVSFTALNTGATPYNNGPNCGALYCHSDGNRNSGSRAYTNPSWSGAAIACNGCHGTGNGQGYPDHGNAGAGAAGSNSHQKHVASSGINCYECHWKTTHNDSTIYYNFSTAHLNGTGYAAGRDVKFNTTGYNASGTYDPTITTGQKCSNTYCHGAPASIAWGDNGVINCTSCHEARNNASISTRHDRHINTSLTTTFGSVTSSNRHSAGDTLYVYGCRNCHTVVNDHPTGPVTPNVQDARIQLADSRSKITDYTPGGGVTTDGKGYEWTNGTCTTACHSKDGTAIGLPTVSWTTAYTGSCKACHGGKGSVVGDFATGTVHVTHLNNYSTNTKVSNCASCHATTAASNTAILNGAQNQHPNQVKNTAASSWVGSGSITNNTCANTYCHSPGQSQTGSHASINWTPGITCASCHGGNRTYGNKISTYAHLGHVNYTSVVGKYIDCKECHAATAASDTAIFTKSVHVNRSTNVKFDNSLNKDTDSPTYNAGSTTGARGYSKAVGNAGASNTCLNVYCHSTGNLIAAFGNLSSASGQKYRTITWNTSWGAGSAKCVNCHGNGVDKSHPVYNSGPSGSATANSHVKHVDGSGIYCNACHIDTVSIIGTTPDKVVTSTGKHLNRVENVRFKLAYGGYTGNYITGSKQCSSTYCHGSAPSPAWGSASLACNQCHEASNVLPSGHTIHWASASLPSKFVNMSGNVSSGSTYRFTCSSCHGSPNEHTDGPVTNGVSAADIFFGVTSAGRGSNANYAYNTSPGRPGTGVQDSKGYWYTASTAGVCNNTYCHSNGQGANGASGSLVWTSTQSSGAARCGVCHDNGSTPASLSGKHAAHLTAGGALGAKYGCVDCHSKTVSNDTTIANAAAHVNKMRDYSGARGIKTGYVPASNCNSYCHSNGKGTAVNPGSWTTGAAIGCAGCHGVGGDGFGTPLPAVSPNSHAKHVGAQTDCVKCHQKTVAADGSANLLAGTTLHTNRTLDVNFKVLNSFTNVSGAYNSGARTCSTTYCHGAAATAAWGTAGATDCQSCHAARTDSGAANGAHWNTNSAHKLHMNSTLTVLPTSFTNMSGNVSTATQYRFTCASCHKITTSQHASGAVRPYRSAQVFYGFTSAGSGSTFNNYTGGAVLGGTDNGSFNWTSGKANKCSTSYCHSNGQATNAAVGAVRAYGNYSVNWATTTRVNGCKTCHSFGNDAGQAGTKALSGRHDKHMNNANYLGSNIKCGDCHAKTVVQGSYSTLNNRKYHVNKFRDYSGAVAFKSGYTNGACSATWCHSNGKLGTGVAYTAPTIYWNAAVQPRFRCNQCHGTTGGTYGEPAYSNGGGLTANNHNTHVTVKGYSCDKCHRNTVKLNSYTTLLSTNTAHLNKNIQDVAFNSYTVAGRGYDAGTKTCNNIYCHSAGGNYTNPVWGGGALDCAGCHKINKLSKGHIFHIYTSAVPTLFNYTANKSTNLRYNYGCAVCHPVGSALHSNGTVELYFASNETGTGSMKQKNTLITGGSAGPVGTAAGTFGTPGTSVKCMNVYCHSNGYTTTFRFYTSPEWYNGSFSGDKCAGCHGNSPNSGNKPGSPTHYNNNWVGTGAAGGHLMGIHAMKVAKGNPFIGRLAASNVEPSSHGVATSSTTINCDTCHNSVVTNPRNDNNAFCVTCHNGQGNPATIADKSKHANGTVAVAFKATTVYSKAQLKDPSFKWISSSTLWHRNNGFKANNSFDSSKQNLNASTYAGGNCTTICHFNASIPWSNSPAATCNSCHTTM
ncbi:MAG: CxxxxCH/CxxCH domain-containing protein [Geobacter sp.]|nr:CxxxxCH/CxxCH domain-containing protein [Geobacter sp.]